MNYINISKSCAVKSILLSMLDAAYRFLFFLFFAHVKYKAKCEAMKLISKSSILCIVIFTIVLDEFHLLSSLFEILIVI